MSAANAYKAKSASFAASAKLGIVGLKTKISGTTTDLLTDASQSVTAVFVDALVADVTVTTTDISAVNSLVSGDVGVLVLVFEHRAEGRAPAGSGNLTATFSNAVLVDNESDAAATATGTAVLTFRCSNPSSGSPVVWS